MKSLLIFTFVGPSNSQRSANGLKGSRTHMKSVSRWMIHKSAAAETTHSSKSSGALREEFETVHYGIQLWLKSSNFKIGLCPDILLWWCSHSSLQPWKSPKILKNRLLFVEFSAFVPSVFIALIYQQFGMC